MPEINVAKLKTDLGNFKGPHQDQHIVSYGSILDDAEAVMIMLHGRGSSAQDILSLAYQIDIPGISYLAPQANKNTWYPYSFLAPVEQNEPELSSALALVESVTEMIIQKGIDSEKIYLLGFSQGACLSLEFAARNTKKYGGIFGLCGGLIGPEVKPENYSGNLENTEIFLGCSDIDPHIPVQRVNETEDVFRKLNASVTKKIYQGMAHTVNQDEIDFVVNLIKQKISSQ
jgi:predicted esterase